jgi:hypothetical protein
MSYYDNANLRNNCIQLIFEDFSINYINLDENEKEKKIESINTHTSRINRLLYYEVIRAEHREPILYMLGVLDTTLCDKVYQ